MKKILFVCDASNFPEGAFRFLETLHQQEEFLLTGAFFHSVNYDMFIPADFVFDPQPIAAFADTDTQAVSASMAKFKTRCNRAGIEYRMHAESDVFRIQDVVKESRFADLLVMSEGLFFAHVDTAQPNKYMRQVLHMAECPLLVVPEKFESFSRVAVAYDGKRASMYALKQFCNLFPGYSELPTEIYYWVDKSDDEIPDPTYIQEYAARHFSNVNFRELFFDCGRYLAQWAHDKTDTLFVTGSYSRSGWSTLFHKSFIDDMVRDSSSLIFIAHNN
jgi:hypothetical protein